MESFMIILINGVPYLDGPEGIYYDIDSDQCFLLKSKRYSFNPYSTRYDEKPQKIPKYKTEFAGISSKEWSEYVTSGTSLAFICEL